MAVTDNAETLKAELDNIAKAIKNKNGASDDTTYTLSEMANDISDISTGADVSGVTATASTVLKGYDFVDNTGEVVHGEIETISDEAVSLSAGGTYDIKSGYHADGATITAKSLASQTGVDSGKNPVTASTMLSEYQGWVNGSKVTGAMIYHSAISATISPGSSYTIPGGYYGGTGNVTASSDFATGRYTPSADVTSGTVTFAHGLSFTPTKFLLTIWGVKTGETYPFTSLISTGMYYGSLVVTADSKNSLSADNQSGYVSITLDSENVSIQINKNVTLSSYVTYQWFAW